MAEVSQADLEAVIQDLFTGMSSRQALKLRNIDRYNFHTGLLRYPSLLQKYDQARSAQADQDAEEIKEIADTDPDPQRARNRIDARKWYASKMNPQRYGDRIDLNVNQTVDIGSALAEAHARTHLVPVRDQLKLVEAKVIEKSREIRNETIDCESVNPSKIDPLDIFR